MKQSDEELKVFLSTREQTCGECKKGLEENALIFLDGDKKALCLSCAGLDHLEFLPSRDAALTTRAKKHSTLWAVVLRWSRARNRCERQGLLVEKEALEEAKRECSEDADVRAERRAHAQVKREKADQEYKRRFAARIREIFPNCPDGRVEEITEHACQKYSGRVGRSAAAKDLNEQAIRLAVQAHVRHAETEYDKLLLMGFDRYEAPGLVKDLISDTLDRWAEGKPIK